MHGEAEHEANATATVYEGGAGCGKTAALVDAALRYAGAQKSDAGTAADGGRAAGADVLVLCASPMACQSFSRRLETGARQNGQMERLARIEVRTARELALDILKTPAVVAETGREARMLCGVSTRVLMEDMKTTGLGQRRLKEMLLFFCKSFSELADADDGWFVSEEERMVHARLQRFLDMRRAYLEPQLCATALRAVEGGTAPKEAFAARHLLFDDYQCASRASQLLACALAEQTMDLAFDAAACTEVFDSYPYARGVDELAEHVELVERVQLEKSARPDGIAYALGQLAAAGAEDGAACAHEDAEGETAGAAGEKTAPDDGVALHRAKTPAEEFTKLAETVAEMQGAGDADAPALAVAAPNSTWTKNCVRALRTRGISCEAPVARAHCTSGKSPASDADARTLCLLRLLADESDALAWRDWCGFGDHLARSGAFNALADYAHERSLSLCQALDGLAGAETWPADGGVGLRETVELFEKTRQAVEALAEEDLRDERALLKRAAQLANPGRKNGPGPLLAQLCLGGGANDMDADGVADADAPQTPRQLAARMCERAHSLMTAPRLLDASAVPVAPYSAFAGCSADALFVTGFVNGFFPDYDYFDTTVTMLDRQPGVRRKNARTLYGLLSAAHRRVEISLFEHTELEAAEKLRAKVKRIYLDGTTRACESVPSDFLELIMRPR